MPGSMRPAATLTRLGWVVVVLACLEVQTTSAITSAGVLAAAALPVIASVAGRTTPAVRPLVLGALVAQSLLHAALAVGTCLSDRPGEGAAWHLAILTTSVAAIRMGDATVASTCVDWGRDLITGLGRRQDFASPVVRPQPTTPDPTWHPSTAASHTPAPTRGPPRRRAHRAAPSTIATHGWIPVTAHPLVPSLL